MKRVYYLPTENIDGSEVVKGIPYIHHAILDCTEKPDVRKLIQDTTDEEHSNLIALAISWQEAGIDEVNMLKVLPPRTAGRDLIAELDALKVRMERLEKK